MMYADGLAYMHDSATTLSAFARAYPPLGSILVERSSALLAVMSHVYCSFIPTAVHFWAKLRHQPAKKAETLQVRSLLYDLVSSLMKRRSTSALKQCGKASGRHRGNSVLEYTNL